ncbi:MAG: type ISP restriction/modification enzyme, partial [Ktedonobacterales bacterium]
EDGTGRRENITDWALARFRAAYGDETIGKWDIFHSVYGLLHHPAYRARYAENLKRELPRLPLVEGADAFRACATIGEQLLRLHLGYESAAEWPGLRSIETPANGPDGRVSFHVEKLRLTPDKSAVVVNPTLTLAGIPQEAFTYRLGNRSALDWVIDQYRTTTDARSGIASDPNRPDDPQYIVRLLGQVITVSMETVRLVERLAAVALPVTPDAVDVSVMAKGE